MGRSLISGRTSGWFFVPAILAILSAVADTGFAQTPFPVQWGQAVNATSTGSAIQKTAGCGGCSDAGGTSVQALTAGDGYIEFSPGPGARLYAGLGSNATSNTDPAQIQYAFSFWADGGWDVRERNAYRTEGRFVSGDLFRVAVVSGQVKYYQNGSLVYSSSVLPTFPLVLDTTLIDSGATLSSATITAEPVVTPPASTITIQTATLPSTRIAQAYSTTLSAMGASGALRWTIVGGALPAGLGLDPSAGTIVGSATAGGTFPVTIRAAEATNPLNATDRAFEMSVLAESPPSVYEAMTDRAARAKGTPPALGGAGFNFSDPVFGTRMMRVTSGAVRPGALDRSYRTPSSTHANAWSAGGSLFYTVSTDGTIVPYAFDRATMRAARLQPTTSGDGGLTLDFFNEPTFSYVVPGVAYGTFSGSGSNLRSIDQYDFSTGRYSQLLNLDALIPNLAGTYTGGLGVSAGAVERLFAFFGGTTQDRHFYLVVFDRNNAANRRLVDTVASTIDGVPSNIPLNFKIHAANIDRSGRYVMLYPTGADLQAPRSAAPVYVWDVETGTFTALPLGEARAGGHDAYGYGDRVNQDCCTSSTWDAAQWQYRSLATPLTTFDLIAPVLSPKEIYLADHPSWHNAQPDRLVPFIEANYRYGANSVPWRAWDEELLGIQTDGAGGGATVWRFAHHRSLVADDLDPSRISFWYTPRPNVSPDGHWALFTSNWDKTLGTDPRGETGASNRQDVFLVELKRNVATLPVVVTTTILPGGMVSKTYSASLQASGGSGAFIWSVANGALPAGLVLRPDGLLSGTPAAAGTFAFTVRAADSAQAANSAEQALTIVVAPAPLPVIVTTTRLPGGVASQPYSATLKASGGSGAFTWSLAAGALPAGQTLNAATGVISGAPAAVGTTYFTVRASDAANPANFANQALSITVIAPPPVSIVTPSLPDGLLGFAYSAKIATSGGWAPRTFSIDAGVLPPGLTLKGSTGAISGTPLTVGSWTFTVRVVDSAVAPTSATRALTIRVR